MKGMSITHFNLIYEEKPKVTKVSQIKQEHVHNKIKAGFKDLKKAVVISLHFVNDV